MLAGGAQPGDELALPADPLVVVLAPEPDRIDRGLRSTDLHQPDRRRNGTGVAPLGVSRRAAGAQAHADTTFEAGSLYRPNGPLKSWSISWSTSLKMLNAVTGKSHQRE